MSGDDSCPAAAPWATNGTVDAMVATDGIVYLGGAFTWAGPAASAPGQSANSANLAAVDAATGEVLGWAPVVSGAVKALAFSEDGTTLYAGGNGFVDAVSVADGTSVQIATVGGTVSGLAVSGSVLYLGGNFIAADGPNYYIDAFDLQAGAFTGWASPAVSGPVHTLAISENTLYAGVAGGVLTVALTPAGFGVVGLLAKADGPVDAIAVSCDGLYVGGGFTQIGGACSGGLAVIDSNGAANAGWSPALTGPVAALAVSDSVVSASAGEVAVQFSMPAITLTSPNGGELWAPGSVQNITWNSVGLGDYVLIRLWNNLSTHTDLVEVPIADGSYAWTVPSTPGTKYRIQLVSKEDSVYTDWSDADFSIGPLPASVTVLAPNGGEVYLPGSAQTLTWTSASVSGNVIIRLWDNFATYTQLGDVPVADGSLAWTAPAAPGNKYRIQIICKENPAITDWSDANFAAGTAAPAITVLSPNGGEVWGTGSSQYIRWNTTALKLTGNVTIRLANTERYWYWVLQPMALAPLADGQYMWTIPKNIPTGQYRVQIVVNGSIADWSDANFTIRERYVRVTSLNNGEVLTPGSQQLITWTSQDLTGDLRIRLWDRYTTYTDIAQVPLSDGSFLWTVPMTEGINWDIQVFIYKNTAYADWTDKQFTIGTSAPQVTITSPNGGETLTAGSTQTITWNSSTLSGNLLIRLWDTLTTYTDVAVVPIYDGTYTWTVPGTPGTDYRLQVISEVNTIYDDWTDGVFSIVP